MPGEVVRYTRASKVPGFVLSTARFSAFSFAPHYHLDCHVALVAEGVQRQRLHGGSLALTRGAIQLMPPGEVHDGAADADASYTLRTFRVSPSLLASLGEEIAGRHAFPSRASLVLHDGALAEHLLAMHAALENAPADPLLEETRVMALFESLFARLLRPAPQSVRGRLAPVQLLRVREFMEANLAGRIVLEDLAGLLGMQRFHFLKRFKRAVGMTPHAWLQRLRLERAAALMGAGRRMPIAAVAQATGFFDQSHFTRAWCHAYGVTPARFQRPGVNFLQDAPSASR